MFLYTWSAPTHFGLAFYAAVAAVALAFATGCAMHGANLHLVRRQYLDNHDLVVSLLSESAPGYARSPPPVALSPASLMVTSYTASAPPPVQLWPESAVYGANDPPPHYAGHVGVDAAAPVDHHAPLAFGYGYGFGSGYGVPMSTLAYTDASHQAFVSEGVAALTASAPPPPPPPVYQYHHDETGGGETEAAIFRPAG